MVPHDATYCTSDLRIAAGLGGSGSGSDGLHPGCILLFRVRRPNWRLGRSWSELSNGGRGRAPSSLGTWRSRISIIAGIKAGASFLGHVPLSFLPGPSYLLSFTGFFLLKVLFRHIIGTNACPWVSRAGLNRDNFCHTFLRPPHVLHSASPRLLFFYLLSFHENCWTLTCANYDFVPLSVLTRF